MICPFDDLLNGRDGRGGCLGLSSTYEYLDKLERGRTNHPLFVRSSGIPLHPQVHVPEHPGHLYKAYTKLDFVLHFRMFVRVMDWDSVPLLPT